MSKIKVYFAAPLFTSGEQLYNKEIMKIIRECLAFYKAKDEFDFYIPQEQPINDKSKYADSQIIAKLDSEKVKECDILIAVLDGQVIDPGVASEIGMAYSLDKKVYGLYTDIRQKGADNKDKVKALREVAENQFHYVNLFTTGLIKLGNGKIFNNAMDLAEQLVEYWRWWTNV